MNISYTNWIISLLCLKPVINDFPYSCYKHWNPYLDRWRLESSSLYFPSRVISISDCLMQGSPTPGLQAGTGPRPVRNRAAQQEVSGGRASEASSASPIAPHLSHYCLNHSPPPHSWKNRLPWNWSLVPKRLGTAGLMLVLLLDINCLWSRSVSVLLLFLAIDYPGEGLALHRNSVNVWCIFDDTGMDSHTMKI